MSNLYLGEFSRRTAEERSGNSPTDALKRVGTVLSGLVRFAGQPDEVRKGLGSLKDALVKLASFGVPKDRALTDQIRLYANLAATLDGLEDKEAETATTVKAAVVKRLALLFREGLGVQNADNPSSDPYTLGLALQKANSKVWWMIAGPYRSAVIRGEAHPQGLLYLGARPWLVEMAATLAAARAVILRNFPGQPPEAVQEGWGSAKDVDEYVSALETIGQKSFELFEAAEPLYRALKARMERRGAKSAPRKAAATRGEKPRPRSKRERRERKPTPPPTAPAISYPDLRVVISAGILAAEIPGEKVDEIRKDLTDNFRSTAELVRAEKTARPWYTKKFGAQFADELFKSAIESATPVADKALATEPTATPAPAAKAVPTAPDGPPETADTGEHRPKRRSKKADEDEAGEKPRRSRRPRKAKAHEAAETSADLDDAGTPDPAAMTSKVIAVSDRSPRTGGRISGGLADALKAAGITNTAE